MMMTRMGSLPNTDTFKTINPPMLDLSPPTDYDFGLPPGLQLVPQKIEFIDLDAEPDDRFVKRHQPETPQAQKAYNPFSAKNKPKRPLKRHIVSSEPTEECYKALNQIKKEIEPLLSNHKKGGAYPKKVIQLVKKAAKDNPEINTKKLAEILGIPHAIVYYWLGYQSPSLLKKRAKHLLEQTD